MAGVRPDRRSFLWRWRPNELRRGSDRAEAWMVLSAWLLALSGSAASGAATASVVLDSAEAQRVDRTQVSASLTEDASGRIPGENGFGDDRVNATVRFTTPDGESRKAQAKVPPESREGSEVDVWTDRDGRPTPAPPSDGEMYGGAAATGALTALGFSGIVVLGERGALMVLDRRRLKQWEEEWAMVGPTWRRKTR